MPDRSRGSESDSATTRSKLRTGGHVVKSGFATTEMSFSVPVSSRVGHGVDAHPDAAAGLDAAAIGFIDTRGHLHGGEVRQLRDLARRTRRDRRA